MNKDAIVMIKDSKHRNQHPFWIWESILSIPQLLTECLTPDMKKRAAELAQLMKDRGIRKIILSGTGSSYFASIAEKFFFEEACGIPTEAVLNCELLHYPPLELDEHCAVFFHSHSGSTLGDPEVVQFVKQLGALTVAVTDIDTSALAQCTDEVFIGPGGKKLELPASRTYATGIFRMNLLASALAGVYHRNGRSANLAVELDRFPALAAQISECSQQLAPEIASQMADISSFFVVGAGPNYATADEAALGISQSAGVPSQAFQVENFIHGPMQTLRRSMGVVAIAPPGSLQRRIFEVATAVKIVGAKLILLAPAGHPVESPDIFIEIPAEVSERMSPIACMIPLWQTAYHLALLGKGGHPDKLAMELPGFKEAMLYLTHQTK